MNPNNTTHSSTQAFQDCYADDYAHCFGCGRLNEHGLQIKSYWDGDESVCRFTPGPYYSGGKKDILYGGLIASLIDCHGAATASAAKAREQNIPMAPDTLPRFLTAMLKVDYLAPTPVGVELELRGVVQEIKNRKITVNVTLSAENQLRAKGELILVQVREAN